MVFLSFNYLLWLYLFRSPLLKISLLIFFPFATKKFQFAKYSFYTVSSLGNPNFIISILGFSCFITSLSIYPLAILLLLFYTKTLFIHPTEIESVFTSFTDVFLLLVPFFHNFFSYIFFPFFYLYTSLFFCMGKIPHTYNYSFLV